MDSRVNDLSAYRYEKAVGNLSLAKSLFRAAECGAALNRAYYAAFDAMRAVNALEGFDSSKHSGVIAHFNQYHVKTKHFESYTSAVVRKASMLREKSDYEDFYTPDPDETAETIELVGQFLQDVGCYLRKCGVSIKRETV